MVIVTRDAARAGVQGLPEENDKDKSNALKEGAVEAVELDGRRSFFKLRAHWSIAIIAWISLLILFNVALACLVGFGTLNFEKYQWFIASVTVETFLQVVGLGYVAAKFLFSRG